MARKIPVFWDMEGCTIYYKCTNVTEKTAASNFRVKDGGKNKS
jgi:hypothetical protein